MDLSCLSVKVHPSSLSIEGTLGNFRLRDMSLGTDHCWAWLCDIRNPGVESLIKVQITLTINYSIVDVHFYLFIIYSSPRMRQFYFSICFAVHI